MAFKHMSQVSCAAGTCNNAVSGGSRGLARELVGGVGFEVGL